MERDGIPHAAAVPATKNFSGECIWTRPACCPSRSRFANSWTAAIRDKRDKLIDSLIGTEEFAEQWAWLWSDLLQTHNAGFSYWFKRGLKLDRPYNEMAKEILSSGVMKTPSSNPVWAVTSEPLHVSSRALVATDPDNYFVLNRLDFMDAMAIGFGRTFLGINMDCISCHDGAEHLEPLNLYLTSKKRSEFHQQAAFWARLNMAPFNMTTGNAVLNDYNPGYVTDDDAPYHTGAESRFPRDGKTYEPAFILTGEKPRPGIDPRKELARHDDEPHSVQPRDGQHRVGPVDDRRVRRTVRRIRPGPARSGQPAADSRGRCSRRIRGCWTRWRRISRRHNYSLHHLIKTIMKSSAYQLSAQFPGEWKDAYAPYYARRYARVISGAEVADNVAQVTGVPYDFSWAGQGMKRVKQLASPIDVNPPQRVGGVNDLGGEGTVEGNSIRALMQSFFQSTRETPALLTNRPSAVQAMLMMTAPTVVDRVAATSSNPSRLPSRCKPAGVVENRQRARRRAVPVQPVATAATRRNGSGDAHPEGRRAQAESGRPPVGAAEHGGVSC